MSFLLQTNEEYIKQQIRSLLSNPSNKKRLKKSLRSLGLYSRKGGFALYPDFFRTEFGHKRSSSDRNRTVSFNPEKQKSKKIKSELPSIIAMKPSRLKGLLSTEFFKKGKKTVSSCVLFLIVSKINIIPGIDTKKVKFPARFEKEFSLKFVPFYLTTFTSVMNNLSKIALGPTIPLPPDIKKLIVSTYSNICSISGNRKVYMRNKDFRIQNFINLKQWSAVISESVHKFFFKKYSIFNEQSFEDFICNFIFSHNTVNQKRLCFEVYDRLGNGFLTTKNLYSFFESSLFQFIKGDLFVMVNFLCNDRYTEETERLKRQSTRIIESEVFKIISTEQKKLTFKIFCKLPFDQKFPDLLLALAYVFFEEAGSNFLTSYFNVTRYKVLSVGTGFHIVRPVNICKNFLKVVKAIRHLLKEKIQEFEPRCSSFSRELVKASVLTFILGCDAEYLCEFKELNATASSLKEGSEFMFGRKCEVILENMYHKIQIPNTKNITLWDFLEHIEGFFDVISKQEDLKHARCFQLYDANGDGVVSITEMISILETGDLGLTPMLQEEINKLTELMENKRFFTQHSGGFIDLANYKGFCPYPAFSFFLKERLAFNLKNKEALLLKRYEDLMSET